MSLGPQDVLIEGAPSDLADAMHQIDATIAQLQKSQQTIMALHIAQQGWSTDTHSINYDISTGLFTVSPKTQEQAA